MIKFLKKIRNKLLPTYREVKKLSQKLDTILQKQNQYPIQINNNPSINPPIGPFGITIYSQVGEDKIIQFILERFFNRSSENLTYIDIGCNHPIAENNTYFFYKRKGKGVLIEPNPELISEIKNSRQNDSVLNIGISDKNYKKGLTFYMTDKPGLNTFDVKRIKEMKKNKHKVLKKIKIPVYNLNYIIKTYLNNKTPEILSIDVEGLELKVLQGLDFQKYRPLTIVTEANWKEFKYGEKNKLIDYLLERDYTVVANTSVNIIFADQKTINFNVID